MPLSPKLTAMIALAAEKCRKDAAVADEEEQQRHFVSLIWMLYAIAQIARDLGINKNTVLEIMKRHRENAF